MASQLSYKCSDWLAWWQEIFSLYYFENVKYLKGSDNIAADFLSRPPESSISSVLIDDPYFPVVRPTSLLSLGGIPQTVDSLSSLFRPSSRVLSPLCYSVLSSPLCYSDLVSSLTQEQVSDPQLGPLIVQRQQSDYNPATDKYRNLYVLVDGLLVVQEPERNRIVVPDGDIKQTILRLYHDYSGHQGADRTLWALQQGFFWPNMSREVKLYCASCSLCQAANASHSRPAGYSQPHSIPSCPGAAWSVDFIELPETKNGL